MRAGMVVALTAVWMAGCATVAEQTQKPAEKPTSAAASPSEDARLAIRNQGYSLLYQLMSDEKNISNILLIKKEQSDVGDLIKKIAETTGEAAKQLEAFEKADPHLHLKMEALPS